ncbi:hypothetical protein, partial [Micrococcus lylae]
RVFDVRAETAHTGAEEIHPNVAVRYFVEPEEGGVASAALRELHLGGESALDGFLPLSYEAFFTGVGLPARRHHVVAWQRGLLWHSLRWYVGSGDHVLELALTVGEGDDVRALGSQCDDLARRVRPVHGSDRPDGLTWPRLPHAMQDLTPETVVTEQDLVPAQVERLSTPEDLVPSKLWSDEISSRQAALIEQRAPLLSGRGVRDGHECHVEICLAGGDEAVVVTVENGGAGASPVRRVATVPVAVAVPLALESTGVRVEWLRDAVFEAECVVGADEGGWSAVAGTSAAQDLLRRPRDWWVWRDREDHVAAEWMQPYGGPPFAVIRGERSSRAVPVVPGIFYAALQESIAATTASEDDETG